MNYFGTSLTDAGHYLWELENNSIDRSRLNYNELPFNLEGLPHKKKGQTFRNGFTQFYNFAGFSILAIEGSCKDERPGSKSIFFVNEEITKEQMIEKVKATPIANKIISKMPFTIYFIED